MRSAGAERMSARPPGRAVDLAPGGCQAHDRSPTRTSDRPRAWRVPGACARRDPAAQSAMRLAGAERTSAPQSRCANDVRLAGARHTFAPRPRRTYSQALGGSRAMPARHNAVLPYERARRGGQQIPHTRPRDHRRGASHTHELSMSPRRHPLPSCERGRLSRAAGTGRAAPSPPPKLRHSTTLQDARAGRASASATGGK